MRINFENFGQAVSGELSLSDLTIICGPNSSGKTYTSYAIYAILKKFSDLFNFVSGSDTIKNLIDGKPVNIDLSKIKKEINKHLLLAEKNFVSGLDRFFNAPDGFFSETKFKFALEDTDFRNPTKYQITMKITKDSKLEGEVDPNTEIMTLAYTNAEDLKIPSRIISSLINNMIYDAILGEKIPSPFVVTSERTGVSLFYKDLDYNSNAIVSHLRDSEKIDPIKIIEAMRSRYAQPIQDNIDTVRDFENISKRKSFLRDSKDDYKFVFDALTDLLGGGAFRSSNGQLAYSPRKKRNLPKLIVPLYIASSSIKSLFLVDVYINHIASKNQILIIDEPELNLHPDNQIKFARLIARLVNSGVKVLVTTHSDYIVREINNLISMSATGTEKEELLKRYELIDQDILKPSQVRAYCANPSDGLSEMNVMESGIDTAIFDTIIASENEKAQDIHFYVEE